MQWATARREQQPANKPVKCLEGQQYRTLWTMAGGNRSCSEYKTTEPLLARKREFAIDMILDLPTLSEGIPPNIKTSPDKTSQQVVEKFSNQ